MTTSDTTAEPNNKPPLRPHHTKRVLALSLVYNVALVLVYIQVNSRGLNALPTKDLAVATAAWLVLTTLMPTAMYWVSAWAMPHGARFMRTMVAATTAIFLFTIEGPYQFAGLAAVSGLLSLGFVVELINTRRFYRRFTASQGQKIGG